MKRTIRTYWGWTALLVGFALALPDAALAQKRLLRLKLAGPVAESPGQEMDLNLLLGGEKTQTLHDYVRTLQKAGNDSKISGLLLILEDPACGFAQAEELVRAMKEFRAKGKKIYCYLDQSGNLDYLLASAADHITLSEYSEVGIVGLHAELSFYKGLLDKIGVEADMLNCGAYKSAVEPYTRTEPSKENAEMLTWLLDGIFSRFVSLIAENRKLTPEQVKGLINKAPLLAKDALESKLVDAVASFPEFKRTIRKEFGQDVEIVKRYDDGKRVKLDFDNPFALFQAIGELMSEGKKASQKPAIAVIYIDGGIDMGRSSSGMFGQSAGSTTIRAAFEQAREDANVRAVVVRVDSPGGSALASDIMWDAATRCAKDKPLIVSMGNVAGSGGYYVSIPGDTIFAEETTITGSIGVLGGKMVTKGLFEDKLGITTTEFNRGDRAGLMSSNRRWNDDERKVMKNYIDTVYKQFQDRIKTSRGTRVKLEKYGGWDGLAAGRVYTGKQALERGLVDQLGGLSDAIRFTADKIGLKEKDYDVMVLPKPKDFSDLLKEILGEETADEWDINPTATLPLNPLGQAMLPMLKDLGPGPLRKIAWGLRNLLILDREHVGCFMPFELNIR